MHLWVFLSQFSMIGHFEMLKEIFVTNFYFYLFFFFFLFIQKRYGPNMYF